MKSVSDLPKLSGSVRGLASLAPLVGRNHVCILIVASVIALVQFK